MRGRLSGSAEDGDRAEISGPGGVLDVVGAGVRGHPYRSERRGAALVRGETPPARSRLVDRPPDERVPETEPARNIRWPDEIDAEKLIDGVDRGGVVDRGRGSRQLGLERVARHRRTLEHAARAVREQAELLGQGGRDALRHLDPGEGDLGAVADRRLRAVERARELLQVERVASARLVELGSCPVRGAPRSSCASSGFSAATSIRSSDSDRCARSSTVARRSGTCRGTDRQRGQYRRGRRPMEKCAEQLDAGRIGPVEVVQDEDERLRRREQLE